MKIEKKKLSIIVLLAFGIIGSYGFPYMKGTFYNIMKEALNLTDRQLGNVWSVFGIIGMISYILGGYVTDRFSPKKIIIIALISSATLHVWMSFVPTYPVVLGISALMGISAIFAFFPSSSKILSCLGDANSSGSIFGIYYALEGLGGMIINFIGSRFYVITDNEIQTFVVIVRLYAFLNVVAAYGIYKKFSDEVVLGEEQTSISLKVLGEVLRKKQVWRIALLILSNFVLYCSLTYITPYLTEVYDMPQNQVIFWGIIRVNILALLAGIIFGKIVDYEQSAMKVIKKVMPVQSICLCVLIFNHVYLKNIIIALILLMTFAFLATGVKVISLVLVSEAEFSVTIIGTVIGVVSFVGFSPDAFLYPLAGWLQEKYMNQSYIYLFLLCFIMTVVAEICCKKINSDKSIKV